MARLHVGLNHHAVAAICVGVTAFLAVVTGYSAVSGTPDSGNVARADAEGLRVGVAPPTDRVRPERTRIVLTNEGAIELARDAMDVDVLSMSGTGPTTAPVPRLKPRHRPDDQPIVMAMAPDAVSLVADVPLAFATQEDFTGGRDTLFAEYAQAREALRRETAYMTAVLGRGETLKSTLIAAGASEAEATLALDQAAQIADLSKLQPGAAIDYALEPVRVPDEAAPEGERFEVALTRLRVRPSERTVVTVWREGQDAYAGRFEELDVERRYAAVAGVINDSLFATAFRHDVPPEVMQRFANLFLYDVDFARDIYRGDRFETVYEIFYDSHGNYVGSGDVLFAGMSWEGNSKSRGYYRFAEVDGMEMPYFDGRGESATRLLMKTPIEGARLSSGFGARRHPILGYTRGHKGVDFAAATGTPIMAAGDGVVERAQRTGTYGHYIKINHNHGFSTAYAHLSGYAKGLKAGQKVRQGQIIGYVGSTGRSTGPHLHYEVERNGDVLNPMTLKVANGRALDDALFEAFEREAAFLDTIRVHPLTVASATSQ